MIALQEEYIPYLAPIFDRKPKRVTALMVSELTSYTDMVVIVEAGSSRQVTSLSEHIIKSLKEAKIKTLGTEGVKEGQWALLDFGHLIIHIFESDAMAFYDLEGLWSDAAPVDLSEFGRQTETDMDDDDGF
ncbi:MAG TPA: ribosome silencing factor [Desulfobacter sp.]|jgi:ribosome-associated protein|uniref:ribosome silencing factor n=1 Tax=unclassified Desulfobacter TaxID=2634406 RepID=UPI000E838E53|nr:MULTISPECIES: ribosome silencing factor [unclassified Desulfobacter]MBP9599402.1 ribosome silencing factor [Desulfobacter sp.]HAR33015.1 ribosome silencing factor [Desulfobacter sp.]HBT87649.1 ribosome silencing factor [Desulfobacter sp.]